ncbi:MAG: DNA repair protein RadA [Clostridia bacterium]|jgi:DNA repair protein RadA/Sms|nr:DNA repair protein RadA [Clostridia bacterium]
MAKKKNVFVCMECGYESNKWLGKCPACNEWNTFSEEVLYKDKGGSARAVVKTPKKLEEITLDNYDRIKTDNEELDRVLGGGVVKGSLVLIGGDPGIGKSTLLLQITEAIGKKDLNILYVSGEESESQIKLRADRLAITTDKLSIITETNLEIAAEVIKKSMPDFVVIDSIQTLYSENVTSAPGSVSQVREATATFLRLSKEYGIPIVIVGHVTKEGAIAGPRVLEHMVDVVLYFEGDRHGSYRVLRTVKNRFGSTNEIGVFEMKDKGLVEISNPSEVMLSSRNESVIGSAITCLIEGTRPLLVETQALVTSTNFGMPRRMATGIDYNKVILLMAVLEKKLGMQLGGYDAYVNLTGGIKISEPAIDLAIVAAIISSYKNKPIADKTVFIGEVGLTGEVRHINLIEKRINEAYKLGFKRCIVPKVSCKDLKSKDIEVIPVKNVSEMINMIF